MKISGGHIEQRPAQRRGSFLVAVVAILALLTVLTIVYVAVGRADAQIGAAVVRERERGEPEIIVRDYIADIIGRDALSVVDLSEVPGTNIAQPLIREAWDYPSTAWAATYYSLEGNTVRRRPVTVGGPLSQNAWFTPTGEVIVQDGTGTNARRLVGTGTDPWLASTEPTVIDFAGAWTDPEDYAQLRMDLAQISILAPDGAFVNLYNLRQDPNDNETGFNATSWKMRANLDLYNWNRSGTRTNQTDFGPNAVASNLETTRPFFWGARQIDAHRPVGDPDYGFNDARYAPYQWADTTGDGKRDGRWFELVEDRDPNNPAARREILSRQGNLRYFIAATVRDLSASVNVNTATDATLAPTREQPAGFTPSHIDLRRLFSMYDFSPDRDDAIDAAGFELYESFVDDPAYENLTELAVIQAGDRAYDSLRLVLSTGKLAGPGFDGLVDATGSTAAVDGEFFLDSTEFFVNSELYGGTGQQGYYLDIGQSDVIAGGRWDTQATPPSYRVAPVFALDSLEELLTFRGLNDPQRATRLELTLFGRGQNLPEIGPLRSNVSDDGEGFFNPGPGGPPADAAGRTEKFIAHSLMDVRKRLTTISGHRPILAADMGLPTDPEDSALVIQDLRTPLTPQLLTNTAELFRLYADALLPWSDYPNAWTSAQLAPLSYGGNLFLPGTSQQYGPELALRISAHMTVNMTDIADTNHEPTRRTLIVDESRRPDIVDAGGVHSAAYPYPLLDLGASRLAQNAGQLIDNTSGRAVNVFGIEAQPFITMVGAMAVYSDVPQAFGGASDERLDIPPPPPTGQPDSYYPNLNTDFSASNPDFLFEVIAVELTNPFDQPIMLSGKRGDFNAPYTNNDDISNADDDGRFSYYLQFGDLYFRLADHEIRLTDARPTTRTAVSLAPGESRVFYCMSLPPLDVIARLNGSSGGDVLISQTAEQALSSWLNSQFGPNAVLMWPMSSVVTAGAPVPDRENGVPLAGNAISTLSNGLLNLLQAGDEPADRDVIRLWYAERPALISGNPQLQGVTETATQNDPITDILVDRMRLPQSQAGLLSDVRRTGGTQEIAGAVPAPDNTDDNRGLTIAQWAMVRRSDDPDRARYASGTLNGSFPAWCIEPVDGFISNETDEDEEEDSSSAFNIADFSSNPTYASETLFAWWTTTSGAGPGSTIIPDLARSADERDVAPLGNNAVQPLAEPLEDLRVEHRLTHGSFTTLNAPRLADLLLPLGIGPMHDPGVNLNNPDDDQWLTLSEALAHAMGYDAEGVPANFDDSLVSFYDQIGVTSSVNALFRGQLYSDAFVPFYDAGPPVGVYNPRATGGNDMPWGLRITPAMRLIQSVVGVDRQTASLSRPIMGTININTAPLEVLRTLPMLSPPVGNDPVLGGVIGSFSGGSQSFWWWANADSTGNLPHDANSDIAATMVAYRDRLRFRTRTPNGGSSDFLDFLGNTFPNNEPPGYDLGDTGQGVAHGISGTSERPGFRSIGEVLAVRDLNSTGDHDIDRLIANSTSLTQLGVVSTLYPDRTNPDTLRDDGLESDYDEQYALANGIFNTISVGSDYYAVWFLLHGYSQEDTQVGPNDPLVPTVARRFVMVVDRSNVVRRGDSPRIVLFREVPVALP